MLRRVVGLLLGLLGTCGVGGAAALAPVAAASSAPIPMARLLSHAAFPTPPTTADCEAQIGIACYAPTSSRRPTTSARSTRKGLTGKGKTIAIVDSFGSPDHPARPEDVRQGLRPAGPAEVHHHPAGRPGAAVRPEQRRHDRLGAARPRSTSSTPTRWRRARTSCSSRRPVAETEGVHGLPGDRQGRELRHQPPPGDVITQSFGATEQTFPQQVAARSCGCAALQERRARHGVTVLGASRRRRRDRPNTIDAQGSQRVLPAPRDQLAGDPTRW